MASQTFQISREKWKEEIGALTKGSEIYMRFWFLKGHVLAKPSKILVDGRTLLLRQSPSALWDSGSIELLVDLPDEFGAMYEKRSNERGGICLSIIYKIQTRDFLQPAEKLHLSNQEDFLYREGSESLLQ